MELLSRIGEEELIHLQQQDYLDIEAFAEGTRQFESCSFALARFIIHSMGRGWAEGSE